jgi:hypothetical protein
MLNQMILACSGLAFGGFLAVPVMEAAIPTQDCPCYKDVEYTSSGNFTGLELVVWGTDLSGWCSNNGETPPVCDQRGVHNCNVTRKVNFVAPSGLNWSKTTGQPGYTRQDGGGHTTWIGIGPTPCTNQGSGALVQLIVVCGLSQQNEIRFFTQSSDCSGWDSWGAWLKLHLTCGGCGVAPPED